MSIDPLLQAMHAVLLVGHGGFEQLKYRDDISIPHPQAGEVLIRVGAAAVNNTDINTRIGWYSQSVQTSPAKGDPAGLPPAQLEDAAWTGSALHFPRIQGIDVCGQIAAVGDGVAPGRIGERVLVEPCLQEGGRVPPGSIWFLGSECDGGFGQFVTVPAAHAFSVKSEMTDVELASFPCSYAAAENMLTRAAVHNGDVVLITGASGGVGSAAIQLARRRGAKVIAVAGRAKAAQVEALGASTVLDRDEDPVTALGKESVQVVIDVVGGPAMPRLLDVLARAGRYAVAGAIGGPIAELDLRKLYLKDLSLFGCTALERSVFPNLIGYIEREEIRPIVNAIYPLNQIVEAQQAFLSKQHVGKIVLVPPDA